MVKRLQRFLDARRDAAVHAWDLTDELVLVSAGDPIVQPGKADRTYPFIPHSDYFWLTDRVRPGSVLTFDPHDGWTDFVPPVSHERVWEGGGETEGVDVAGLADWLEARAGRPTRRSLVRSRRGTGVGTRMRHGASAGRSRWGPKVVRTRRPRPSDG